MIPKIENNNIEIKIRRIKVKKTPLYEKHKALGAKLIDFGGWALPVQYTGIIEEHKQVRNTAGLFDVSHMGEITVKGEGAQDFLQLMMTNNIRNAADGQAVYTPMCYPNGGVVDDLLVYKRSADDYLLVVNASNTDKDFDWLKKHSPDDVLLENVSSQYVQLAVQGPKAQEIMQRICDVDLKEIKFYHFKEEVSVGGVNSLVSRTGYTGEDGFEVYADSKNAEQLWDALLEAGKGELKPIGLGARDTLRFEVALPLYGHELSADITPVEAGIGFFVKLDKGEFFGSDIIVEQKVNGPKRKVVGFEMVERGVPRSHYEVAKDGKQIGFVTSGSFSPSLNKTLGMALIDKEYAKPDTEIEIVIRNKPVIAKVIKKPFYNKKYAK